MTGASATRARTRYRAGLFAVSILAVPADGTRAAGLDDEALTAILAAPTSELPAKVAEAVRRSPGEAVDIACDLLTLRIEAVVTITRAAARTLPAAAPKIVSCAVAAASEAAGTIAAAVATALPAQTEEIVQAACAAAPEVAGEIAEAVARAVPARADAVRAAAAAAVARWVPATNSTEPPSDEAPGRPR